MREVLGLSPPGTLPQSSPLQDLRVDDPHLRDPLRLHPNGLLLPPAVLQLPREPPSGLRVLPAQAPQAETDPLPHPADCSYDPFCSDGERQDTSRAQQLPNAPPGQLLRPAPVRRDNGAQTPGLPGPQAIPRPRAQLGQGENYYQDLFGEEGDAADEETLPGARPPPPS